MQVMTISWPTAVMRGMWLGCWHSSEWHRLLLTILAQNRILCSKRHRIRLLAGGRRTNVKAVRDASTVQTSAPPRCKRSIFLFMLSPDVVSKVKESCGCPVSFSVSYRTFSEMAWLHRLPSPARSREDGVRVIDTILLSIELGIQRRYAHKAWWLSASSDGGHISSRSNSSGVLICSLRPVPGWHLRRASRALHGM